MFLIRKAGVPYFATKASLISVQMSHLLHIDSVENGMYSPITLKTDHAWGNKLCSIRRKIKSRQSCEHTIEFFFSCGWSSTGKLSCLLLQLLFYIFFFFFFFSFYFYSCIEPNKVKVKVNIFFV